MNNIGYSIEETPGGLDLVVHGQWSSATESQLSLDGVNGLVLNYARGFSARNLDFLYDLPIRRLKLLARTISDIEPIHALGATLERLDLEAGPRSRLDLSRLPRLRHLVAEWPQIFETIHAAPDLEELYIGVYDGLDLTPLGDLRALVTLRMKDRPRLERLAGLDAFPLLRKLEVASAQHLTDFSALRTETRGIRLEELDLESDTKLSSLVDLSQLQFLTMLNISACGDIDSLRPIANLAKLQKLAAWETTRFMDGDLSPLLGFPNLELVAMQSRRMYRPPLAEVKAEIDRRNEQRNQSVSS